MLAIGQAGENLVKFACPLNDEHHVAGRGGIGAVMGSKKLKAIAAGVPGRSVWPGRKNLKKPSGKPASASRQLRTPPAFLVFSRDRRSIEVEHGCIPGKNYQTGILPDWLETHGREVAAKYVVKKEGTCYACRCPASLWLR